MQRLARPRQLPIQEQLLPALARPRQYMRCLRGRQRPAKNADRADRHFHPTTLETGVKVRLWMMERCGWARKPGQEYVLAVRIARAGWEEALAQAVLTAPQAGVYADAEAWRRALDAAPVRVQWDPERTLNGASLPQRSIQVGLSRAIIGRYVNEWTVAIGDVTPLVKRIDALRRAGERERARALLPHERVYPVSDALRRRLGMSPQR